MNATAPIRKAVFPVAGLGTRFLPITKSVPKELLPVVDKPLIQYAVDEAIQAGIDSLIFVISPSKTAVAEYFGKAEAIESKLEEQGKHELLAKLRGIVPDSVSVSAVIQHEALGLGHAVLQAAEEVGDEPCAVILPDDMVLDPGRGALKQLVHVYAATGASVIGVETIPAEDTRKYGVVGVESASDGHLRIREMVEKPEPADAPSNLGVVGRYLLTPDIFEHLRLTGTGVGGEIQLTDAIAAMLEGPGVFACAFEGTRYDCGSRRGFLKATIDYALADAALHEDVLAHISSQVKRHST
jgi:UTP--glucose-1-phosphate uridylyltransferase